MKFLKYFIKEWLFPILVAIILAILIYKFLFFNITVPSESMYPTIKIGDKITVTRVYNKDNLKRGDLIVFDSEELKIPLIKRLIGLPGDEVIIKNKGQVFINGSKIEEPYVVYMEDLDKKFKIPENKYLFFGDNRANSFDARRWENPYIDGKDIKGKAQFIIYPFKRLGKFVIGDDALNH
ncbi:signal peptidase I [Clostridium sp. CM028]|uniref:signal peptidase I n=1 Tax=unclassified Clostridium TaxID=2614128 RepID=UPI001C0C99B4|nr:MULTISPECIES: signal peptidase I [unclassified Clostridium]MBU3091482.1 signal peptidase I [Clostridium sp. CF011]MBW9145211.1 signal peptidase I [Clostridium sp. CM027]MBW9148452.1 signal peptidase I [Clostridium sp. CM028]UVE40344.1 signal peptidase I [Clostridium sp. CM027]WAG69290.1 signal peptidase I [Clostridium sp. CF011]